MPRIPINTASVARPGAFLGRITRAVRDLAARRLDAVGGGLALDVGCGNGLLFASLSVRRDGLIGVDYDLSLLREAKQVFSDNNIRAVRLVRGDAGVLPFRNRTIDNIFFINTLYNISNNETVRCFLNELMRICRPGGRIFVDVRNAANPYLRAKYWWHNRQGEFPTHTYPHRQIAGMFVSAGFQVVARYPVGLRFPFGAFAYILEARSPMFSEEVTD